jgi:hypothetical protein
MAKSTTISATDWLPELIPELPDYRIRLIFLICPRKLRTTPFRNDWSGLFTAIGGSNIPSIQITFASSQPASPCAGIQLQSGNTPHKHWYTVLFPDSAPEGAVLYSNFE